MEEEERLYPQICKVSIELSLDLEPAAASDAVADTVNYAELCDTVQQVADAREYGLVEAFAGAVAKAVLNGFPVEKVKVFVEKTPLPLQGKLDSVGVELTRRRRG